MKTVINLIAGILFLVNTSFANEINYKLDVTNINFTSESTLEFDIYILSSGENAEEFKYAAGQYFLDFNPKIANSGTLTYSIIKSDLPESMLPRNSSVSGNQLRMAVNKINSDKNSLPVIPNQAPGLLIARMKLETSAKEFSKEDINLKWSGAENNFVTKVLAYTNERLEEITKSENHLIETDNPEGGNSVTENTTLPTEFSLLQNYPNPFNPSTKINYDLPVSGFVKIVVYDITGKAVATLVNEQLNAGRYEATFSGANLASGMYFYKITAGNFSAIKKMVLVK